MNLAVYVLSELNPLNSTVALLKMQLSKVASTVKFPCIFALNAVLTKLLDVSGLAASSSFVRLSRFVNITFF